MGEATFTFPVDEALKAAVAEAARADDRTAAEADARACRAPEPHPVLRRHSRVVRTPCPARGAAVAA